MAMILVSHDLGVVAQTCDRSRVMYAGHVVEDAPAAELFAPPQHPYTVALLEALPELDPARRPAARADPRPAARPRSTPGRLPVRAALPACARRCGEVPMEPVEPAGRRTLRLPVREATRADERVAAGARACGTSRSRSPCAARCSNGFGRRRGATPRGALDDVVARVARRRRSASSASPGAARRRSRAASCGSSSPTPARSSSTGPTSLGARARELQQHPPAHADGVPGSRTPRSTRA